MQSQSCGLMPAGPSVRLSPHMFFFTSLQFLPLEASGRSSASVLHLVNGAPGPSLVGTCQPVPAEPDQADISLANVAQMHLHVWACPWAPPKGAAMLH